MIESFPLHWPVGYKRTSGYLRKRSSFKQTADRAQQFLDAELKRMGATKIIISTNIPLRRDGFFYAAEANKKLADPGAAVYFRYKNRDIAMCCDQYEYPWENIYALGKGVEALRGMDRWGVSDFLDRVFTGFTALPEPEPQDDIWLILGLNVKPKDVQQVKDAYREKAKKLHPDAGGTVAGFQRLQDAYARALKFYS